MRNIKIVSDSSSDVLAIDGFDYAAAPMKVITAEREFIDDEKLDVYEMVDFLKGYKGESKSSCPNTDDWLTAFGEADEVFCVTITSALSGSCNAARSAKLIYEDENEGKRVFVIDSLSAGPELRLIINRLCMCIDENMTFDEICEDIKAYQEKTGLLFMLKSLTNFANNGRVSPITAKLVGVAGICIVGKASDEGTLEPTDKCRGEKRALQRIVDDLFDAGLSRGRIYISHSQNESGAQTLKTMIEERSKEVKVEVFECRGLCGFYAEKGGILVGYEKF